MPSGLCEPFAANSHALAVQDLFCFQNLRFDLRGLSDRHLRQTFSRSAAGARQTDVSPSIQDSPESKRPEDLVRVSRLKALYGQAVRAGWPKDSTSNLLNWFGASVRARAVGGADPVRIFVAIARRNAWHLITNQQEERARSALNRAAYDGESPEFESKDRKGCGVFAVVNALCNRQGVQFAGGVTLQTAHGLRERAVVNA